MNLPNWITFFRMILVPAFIACLVYWQAGYAFCQTLALVVFGVACFTDALDGFIARRTKQQTRLGTMIDPLADKLLLVAAYLSLTLMEQLPLAAKIPPWLTLIVVSRDILLLTGAVVVFALQNRFDPRTNFLGKVTTVSQMCLVVGLLAGCGVFLKNILMAATTCFTLASGASYMRAGTRMLSNGGKA